MTPQKSPHLWLTLQFSRSGTEKPVISLSFNLWQFNPDSFSHPYFTPHHKMAQWPSLYSNSCSIHFSDAINEIGKKVEDLIGKINDSRSRDQTVMDGFQQELMNKVIRLLSHFCQHLARADVNLRSNYLDDTRMRRDEGKYVHSLWRQ